ncbi:MAG TPA: nuclear transport factor 2 family protein [Pyrinomonadaceae bacterium]|jgi:predicted small secreted protein
MKRLLALAALLVAASACTTATDNTNTGAGNTNANAAATATPAGVTQADIEARERQVLDAFKAKNWDAFGRMLADDFVYVSSEGVAGKAQTLEGVKKYDLTEYTLSDVRLVKIDADLALITYTMTEKSSYDGKPGSGSPVRTSSAWAGRGGNWLNVYHQETEVAEMPAGQPTPSPAASPASSPSPAATPAAPASATEAEKAVWEAIKAGNSDAFANYLLPEALEVEPEGVFDKATQVRMISMFDASKFTQSDFKETKFDADAALVTYTVKGSVDGKTVTEYHSTIWTNRGGQWRATFHQGSRQRAPEK